MPRLVCSSPLECGPALARTLSLWYAEDGKEDGGAKGMEEGVQFLLKSLKKKHLPGRWETTNIKHWSFNFSRQPPS